MDAVSLSDEDRVAVERTIMLLHVGISGPKSNEDLIVEARLWELLGETKMGNVLREAAAKR